MIYKLKFIEGTKEFVLKELLQKFPESEVLQSGKDFIRFGSKVEDVDEFRILYSALSIEDSEVNPPRFQRNLYRREWRKEYVPAGINPTLAYVMCELAEISKADVVLDPFCGGGTIPISAAVYFNPKKVLASDLSGNAVDITIRNFKAAKVQKFKYNVFRSDVAQLKLQKDYVTKVITNLPFGVRTGDHDTNIQAYKSLANKMKSVLKQGGLLVMLTQEKELVREYFSDKNFQLINEFDVKQGGLIPAIFIYKKV